jgi:putative phosphoribosyl transferase
MLEVGIMQRKAAEAEVSIDLQRVSLPGLLEIPAAGQGIVVFAHGSGSSRLSPRNAYVAQELRRAGMGTLLFDLLTEAEDADYSRRFDIPLLSERLLKATEWLVGRPEVEGKAVGYFGASTGSAAALHAAADLGTAIRAVVSRGGRPDLARDALPRVKAPTLLIVGENDPTVIALNREAYAAMTAEREIAIVPRATHLFEEPGTLEEVARLARDWFARHWNA